MTIFKPIRSEKFSQEVANKIKESIFNDTFTPGDKLPSENQLAKAFGVSNVTIRQAVRVLESSGILYTKQGVEGGIFVAEANTASVSSYLSDMLMLKRVTMSDLTMARVIFEPEIAYHVSMVWSDGELENVENNIRAAEDSLSQGKPLNARMLNLQFHQLLCNIIKNPVVTFALDSVIDVLEENVIKSKFDKDFTVGVIASHRTIMDKIRNREKEEARDEMKKHIERVHGRLGQLYRIAKRV
ncbi:MAG: FadR family transcriptional regulator [Deltaproteobacteria bacterium]|nr:FadR family transcriptional regulator [Deltaproteobacteria bacterium]